MPDSAPQQLLHLVIGGELTDLEHITFKDLDQVEIVGVYPNYASALRGLEGEGAADRRQRPHALLRGSPPPAARSRSRHEVLQLKRFLRDLLRSTWVQRALGVLAAEYLRLVWLTNRFSYEPADVYERVEPEMPAIFAFWHGQHFMTPFIKTKESYRAKVLISRHRDGEFNAIAAERLGIGTIRGSGDHGGAFHRKGGVGAFREMLQALEDEWNVATTADVPKRARVVGLGVIMLAREFGPADHAVCDGDHPVHPVEELGLYHHQFAVRARCRGRHRSCVRAAGCRRRDYGKAASSGRNLSERSDSSRLCGRRASGGRSWLIRCR